jgi:hypothetical protein
MARMEAPLATCPGCGLERPAGAPQARISFHTSNECWAVYLEVLQREYQDPELFGQVHQLTVDAYAAQHVGGSHPDKSVDVHLVGLHLVFGRGLAPLDVPRRLQVLASAKPEWPRFEPPKARAPLTVLDVAGAATQQEHAERARKWAAAVWDSWSDNHAAIAELAKLAFGERSDARLP